MNLRVNVFLSFTTTLSLVVFDYFRTLLVPVYICTAMLHNIHLSDYAHVSFQFTITG